MNRGNKMAGASGPTGETMGFLVEEMPVLSGNARKYVRKHRREAGTAVPAALEAIAAQRDLEDVPEQLRSFVVRRGDEGILGVSETAKRLEVSRTTIYAWAQTNRLIAWKTTKRGL